MIYLKYVQFCPLAPMETINNPTDTNITLNELGKNLDFHHKTDFYDLIRSN